MDKINRIYFENEIERYKNQSKEINKNDYVNIKFYIGRINKNSLKYNI